MISSKRSEISIIIPVFNEIRTIDAILRRVLEVADSHCLDSEIIVVDDGSSDGTRELLPSICHDERIKLLFHPENRGKGAAIRTALGSATRELVVIQDADLEYDPEQIDKLIEAMKNKNADVVYGSRVLGAKEHLTVQRKNIYALGVFVLNLAVRCLYGLRLTDEATCYKLFRREDLNRMNLACERFEFCPEVTAKAARLGLVLVEVPITYHPRSIREGKKIGLKDAVIAFKTLWKFRKWLPDTTTNPKMSNCGTEAPQDESKSDLICDKCAK